MEKITTLLFFLMATLTGQAQWRGFQPVQTYTVGDTANLILTKDITGDGIPDLTAMYTAYDDRWDILKGNGNGSFSIHHSQANEYNYFLSDIADLNRDGYPDMVISSYWNNGFTLWFGNASGHLLKGPYMYTGVHGRAIKCIDINKDGLVDIVSTTSGSGNTISLHVFISNGNGTFQPKRTFPSVLDTCKDIFITDKNNDGRLDVAVSSSFPWIVIFVQNADGSFAPTYHPTFTQARVAFSDVNNDGKEDLVMLYASFDNMPGSDSLIIKLNNGTDYFTPSIRVPAFENRKIRPYRVYTADINKDGKADLLFNHTDMDGESTDSIFYMLGKGQAQFEEPVAMVMPGRVAYLTLADLNGDQWIDLIVSCVNKTINVSLNHFAIQHTEENLVKFYPNPASSRFYIEARLKTIHQVRLYNAAGQLVHQQTVNNIKTPIYTHSLVAGIYYVDIKGKEINMTQTILVQ